MLTVSFLDVGQGDATFVDAPSGRQALIDGGPNASILRALSEVMPWYDRTIDIVVATHPDLDHFGGLIDVLARYKVGTVVISSVKGTSSQWLAFEERVREQGGKVVYAKRGQYIDMGKGARLEILFPDRDVAGVESNVGCVVSRVVYKKTSFMLPCDAPDEIENYITRIDGEKLSADVLKIAHHGSKTSSSPFFVGAVSPQFAIYSRGCDNSYGHPHAQTVETFARFGVTTLDTCVQGTVGFVSDGQIVRRM